MQKKAGPIRQTKANGKHCSTIHFSIPKPPPVKSSMWKDMGFQEFREAILGYQGVHLAYINEVTGTQVRLEGDDESGLVVLHLVARDSGSLQEGVQQCKELLGQIVADFEENLDCDALQLVDPIIRNGGGWLQCGALGLPAKQLRRMIARGLDIEEHDA